jgi:amphi-Trp domain-containing protein
MRIHRNALPEDKMSKDTMTATGTVDFQRAITLLEGILTRMKEGRLVFGAEGDKLEITPSDRVELGIQAQNTDGIQGFSFDLKWTGNKVELEKIEKPFVSGQESPGCSLAVEEACACGEDDFELAFLKEVGFFQPTTCST